MLPLLTAYAQLTAQAQGLCDAFPYAERLTAYVGLGIRHDNGQPFVSLSAHFEGMSDERDAELRAAGVAAPRCFVVTELCADEREALTQMATQMALPNPFAPIAYATGEQKEQIKALLNHPRIYLRERTTGLLNINRFTTATADEVIVGLKKDINARSKYTVFGEVVNPYAVVGEVFQVAAA